MNEDELRREFERLATAKPYEFDIDRYVEYVQPADLAGKYADETTQDAWELFQSGAHWADTRARRECVEIAKKADIKAREECAAICIRVRDWNEDSGHDDGCIDCSDAILDTIKEPST